MLFRGARIQIAGSISSGTDPKLARYAHNLIRLLVSELTREGASFIIEAGHERKADGHSLVFDWEVLSTFHRVVTMPGAQAPEAALFVVQNVDDWRKIPSGRRALWKKLEDAGLLSIGTSKHGWGSGAVRRQQQSLKGDALLCIGGGEGVEHLATLYREQNKPVIAFDLQLGSSRDERARGGPGLYKRMIEQPDIFFETVGGADAGNLLAQMHTREGKTPAARVVARTLALLRAIAPPRIFFVRLLDDQHADIDDVNWWFDKVVRPVATARGYAAAEMGTHRRTQAWMNTEIFHQLRQAPLVVADLTGERPNCYTELGYALGQSKNVLMTFRKGTPLPYDNMGIEGHPWTRTTPSAARKKLQNYWSARLNLPPLAAPPAIL